MKSLCRINEAVYLRHLLDSIKGVRVLVPEGQGPCPRSGSVRRVAVGFLLPYSGHIFKGKFK